MSPNIQETEAASRKRSHDEYAEGAVDVEVAAAASAATPVKEPIISASVVDEEADQPPNNTALSSPLSSPPMSSSPAANTDGGSNTSPHNSPSPKQTTSAPSTAMAPSKKPASDAKSSSTTKAPSSAGVPAKKRRTPAEIQAEQAEKQANKAREEQERAAKRQKKEEEKAEKERVKEEEKAEREKARLAREAARKEKEAEKEALRKKKQDEEDKKKAEEEKKRRQQPTLSMMFAKKPKADAPPPTPVKQTIAKPADPSPAVQSSSPAAVKQSNPEKLPYERLFQPFFVKSGMTLAQPSFAQMSDETVTAKSKILDEYIYGQRGEENVKPFNAVSTFHLSGLSSSRGIVHPSVKKIMAELLGDPIESANRTESQQARFSDVQRQLSKIPVKLVSFYEDVRPAYVGTVTSFNPEELNKLARRPTSRVLTKLNYEYDSEAEWEEEEGEDLDDADDDEEGDEGDDEMADFLDDAEDAVAVRTAHLPEEEPKSTGICFENRQRAGPCPTVYKYRMEFLLDSLPHHHSIDPFATDYWEQPKPAKTEATTTSVAVRSSPFDKGTAGGMPPPPNPAAVDPKDMVPTAEMANFKRAIISDDISMLTKVSMIDMLSKRFKSCTKAQVRATLEIVAERVPKPGGKKSERYWSLRPEHAL
ncbi:hypothetical protein PG991_010391 [Apiospora marii]|uniref:Chromatin assembly factor 1 subunit A n=1 Tax=Apiospora marii TaxID=335849 RepID=A0ABR1RID4_9PEZI